MTDIQNQFEIEMNHIKEIRDKYAIWTCEVGNDQCDICDSWRVLKVMMAQFNETEEQVIERWEKSTIDNPIVLDDEEFWLEND